MALLTLERVRYCYRNAYQTVYAVNGVDYAFEKGRFYAIVGASGSGKTTLLSLLAGLDVPTEGSVAFNGTATAKLDRDDYRLEIAPHLGHFQSPLLFFAFLCKYSRVPPNLWQDVGRSSESFLRTVALRFCLPFLIRLAHLLRL